MSNSELILIIIGLIALWNIDKVILSVFHAILGLGGLVGFVKNFKKEYHAGQ